jgi:hypothetical protein
MQISAPHADRQCRSADPPPCNYSGPDQHQMTQKHAYKNYKGRTADSILSMHNIPCPIPHVNHILQETNESTSPSHPASSQFIHWHVRQIRSQMRDDISSRQSFPLYQCTSGIIEIAPQPLQNTPVYPLDNSQPRSSGAQSSPRNDIRSGNVK